MAGGIGSRLWPLSTPEVPKQFIDVLGVGKSLIQLTVERFAPVCEPGNFWVVTGEKYVDLVKEQLPLLPPEQILAEPEGRNTAPCIAYASWKIQQKDPEANIVVTPADALVLKTQEFAETIAKALAFTAERDAIVTVGIAPTRPETGYGYIHAAEALHGQLVKVSEFREKPDLDTAIGYLEDGHYFWNAGIFVWNVKTITEAIKTYKPNIASDMERMKTAADVQEVFPQCEKISIDYAVMEPAAADGKVYTHPADFGWSDLGNWASLHDKLQKDSANNGAVGKVHLYECSNCVVHAEEASKVVLQGLDGYIVSAKGGRLLVCKRSEEQRIKEFSQQ
jgi:mannose-1-phosphate guanylyltransferase